MCAAGVCLSCTAIYSRIIEYGVWCLYSKRISFFCIFSLCSGFSKVFLKKKKNFLTVFVYSKFWLMTNLFFPEMSHLNTIFFFKIYFSIRYVVGFFDEKNRGLEVIFKCVYVCVGGLAKVPYLCVRLKVTILESGSE